MTGPVATPRVVTNHDTWGLVILLAVFAVVLALTVASVAWRLTGHGPILELQPGTTTVPTVTAGSTSEPVIAHIEEKP